MVFFLFIFSVYLFLFCGCVRRFKLTHNTNTSLKSCIVVGGIAAFIIIILIIIIVLKKFRGINNMNRELFKNLFIIYLFIYKKIMK